MNLVFSSYIVYKYILAAVVILLLLRLFVFVLPSIFSNKKVLKKINKYYPIFEFLVWFIFLIQVFKVFLLKNQYFAFAIFVITLAIAFWASKILLKDYFAGLLFKTNYNFNIGDVISYNKVTGKIVNLSNRVITLETESTKLIQIPYSKLTDTELSKKYEAETIYNHQFILKVKQTQNITDIKQKLKVNILNLPWISLKKEPIIIPISENSDYIEFELTVFTIEKEFSYKIEKYLKEKYLLK